MHIKVERWDTSTFLQACSSNPISFPNIRSLCLARCSKEQFEQVLNYHKLTRLSLPPNDLLQDFLERYVLGKDGEQRFPQLRSIGRILCPYGKKYDNSSSITNNTIIQHVHLIAPSCHLISNFLQCLPELQSVTVDYLANNALFSYSCLITVRIRHQPNGGFSHVLSKLHLSAQFNNQMKLSLLSIAACIYHVEIDFSGHCDFKKLGHILDHFSILEHVQIRVKYYSENLNLTSIRGLSRFFAALTFGDVQKETGKPILVAKWSLGDFRRT